EMITRRSSCAATASARPLPPACVSTHVEGRAPDPDFYRARWIRAMKNDIPPSYHPVVFQDAGTCTKFLTRSTLTSERTVEWEDCKSYPLVVVDVTSEPHPFWTGAQRVMDTAGRVEKFQRRYGNRTRRSK